MQRYLIPLLLLLGALLPAAASAQSETAWWQAEWQYRKPITLDAGGAGIAGSIGRAPVLVRLHAGNFAFDGVNADGSDLRFVGADGRTVLNHQIERFDPELGLALIWVDVPQLGAAAQTLWMYYGNATAPASGNGQLAFDPDYVLVYHFAEDGAPRDTTAYGNHTRDAGERDEGAAIGRGLRLQGQGVAVPASPSLAAAAGGALTVSAWVRPEAAGPQQTVFARRGGEGVFVLGLDAGAPFVQVGESRAVAPRTIAAGAWSHLAAVAGDGQVVLYVDGAEAARLEAALPALDGDAWIGADAPPATVEGADDDAAAVAAAVRGNPFVGAIDELRVSKVARPAVSIQADVASQGPESRLVAFGEDEQSAGVSHFGFILQAMPVDAWVVVAVLALMLLASWAIMIAKSRYFGAIAKANAVFARHYHEAAGAPLATLGELAEQGRIDREVQETSTLWRLYRIALDEVRGRQSRDGAGTRLGAASIAAIRASMDAEVVRESERMSRRMNWLSTTIEGAPYIGLLGTVIGIMLVFAVAAMAGAVDINSVAPGMAAALLCTAAGLGVAIPALFGYNWLVARSEAIAADMAVFVDEFTARLAEEYDEAPAPFAPAAAAHL
ncbi:DUF2341 domain-containing protein [Luteimonas huabeiensis]|uniref:DUF2341 domain-containing protein n=1 Tax=Luteimonas huabeiensis TaxID=1244513 RepID=UPI0004638A02|nr:DUF2341 domain-containing protein [Luteimonas huabeiensis]